MTVGGYPRIRSVKSVLVVENTFFAVLVLHVSIRGENTGILVAGGVGDHSWLCFGSIDSIIDSLD
jgi:hypothetical protein